MSYVALLPVSMHGRRRWLGMVAAASLGRASGQAVDATNFSSLGSWQLRPVRRLTVAAGPPRHRAFPGIVKLRSGDLLVSYREGTDHWRTPDGVVRLVRSSDGGRTWSEPRTVAEERGLSFGSHSGITQLSDGTILLPVMYMNGNWGAAYAEYVPSNFRFAPGPLRMAGYLLRSHDDGRTWERTAPPNVDSLSSDFWWNTYGTILQLGDTPTVLWPIGRQKRTERFWRTGILASRDLGQTWTDYFNVAVGMAEEKSLIGVSAGRLLALVRDLKPPNYLHQCESADGGKTWTPPRKTEILGHCPLLFRTQQGVLLALHRNLDPDRPRGVGLHYSFDEGQHWQTGKSVYDSPEPENRDCSYPGLVQLDSREMLCVYYTAFRGGNSSIEGVILREEG